MAREWTERHIYDYGISSFGLCWTDTKIVEEDLKTGISGIIVFFNDPHAEDARNRVFDIEYFDKIVLEEGLYKTHRRRRKLIGVTLQEQKAKPVSRDNEHFIRMGFTFVAHGLLNYLEGEPHAQDRDMSKVVAAWSARVEKADLHIAALLAVARATTRTQGCVRDKCDGCLETDGCLLYARNRLDEVMPGWREMR